MALVYTFQPDCFRPAGSTCNCPSPSVKPDANSCAEVVAHLDLGPQIAVWLETADRTQFIDTLMVTSATAQRGIGNRPGRWDFLSGPFFPYGKRQMSLPIWAHARGKLYPLVNMIEDQGYCGPAESCLGWHESYSTPEPYFCRPLRAANPDMPLDVNMQQLVDAITCPSVFNSEKGRLDQTATSYYPPRADLTTFAAQNGTGCGSPPPAAPATDPCDPRTYTEINDLDAVAAATPKYGNPFSNRWIIPAGLPPGDYALMVEVNKEFDTNAANSHASFVDSTLAPYGQQNNFGQPSVVYRVPIHIDSGAAAGGTAAISEIYGYGDWSGAVGDISPKDSTISTADFGSGELRLLSTDGAGGIGRVHVEIMSLASGHPSDIADLAPAPDGVQSSAATFQFTNAAVGGQPVQAYEVRYLTGSDLTAANFSAGLSGPMITPGAPGSLATFTVPRLKPKTDYVVGIRALGACGDSSAIATVTFTTPAASFQKVEGCFIATAAWGSELEPHVASMRRVRDRLRPASALFALATDLYYRSGPAAAGVIRRSDSARALVRRLLAPVAAVADIASLGD
jgi:hypothetical protein